MLVKRLCEKCKLKIYLSWSQQDFTVECIAPGCVKQWCYKAKVGIASNAEKPPQWCPFVLEHLVAC